MNNFNNHYKVTIGITCFNAEKTISEAIDSAINQNWSNKEIIIIDDGSTDNSQNIINSKIKNKKIILIINQINKGTSYSRNKIIENSSSNIICFMDDDDYSDPERIQKQMRELILNGYPNNKYIACCTGIKKFYENGYFKNYFPMGAKGGLPKGMQLANYLLFYEKIKGIDYGFALPTCSLMITKKCFDKFGKFDINLTRVEDMELSIRLSLGSVSFVSVKEILVKQKIKNLSISQAKNNFNSEIFIIKKYKNYLSSKGLYEHALLWPELRFNYFNQKYKKCLLNLIHLIIDNPFRTLNHFFKTGFERLIHDLKNGSLFLIIKSKIFASKSIFVKKINLKRYHKSNN